MNQTNKKMQEITRWVEIDKQNRYKKEVVEFYASIISNTYEKASSSVIIPGLTGVSILLWLYIHYLVQKITF